MAKITKLSITLFLMLSIKATAEVIFFDDFESGTFDKWDSIITETGMTAEINQARTKYRNFGACFIDGTTTGFNCKPVKALTLGSTIYYRIYTFFSTEFMTSLADSQKISFGGILGQNGKYVYVSIYNHPTIGHSFQLQESVTWGVQYTPQGFIKNTDAWYCFEVKLTSPTANCRLEWWVNEQKQADIVGKDMRDLQYYDEIRCGFNYNSDKTWVGTIYQDELIVSDQRIGTIKQNQVVNIQ